jgi:DUF4097 and DUF4098 domain-containing protein YvlB
MAAVRITAASGRVHVVAEARAEVAAEGAKVEASPDGLTVTVRSKPAEVRVPAGSDLTIGSRSGDVVLDGALGAVSVTTDSGDVRVEEVAALDARTVSGDLQVGVVHGALRLRTTSGRVHVGRAGGEVRIGTVSGGIDVEQVCCGMAVKTVSGTIDATLAGPPGGADAISAETVSGAVVVRVPASIRPAVRIRTNSGTERIDCPLGGDCTIEARTVSGPVTVERA